MGEKGKGPSRNMYKLHMDKAKGREKERDKNINVWLPLAQPPTENLGPNPSMCSGWESKWQPFGS